MILAEGALTIGAMGVLDMFTNYAIIFFIWNAFIKERCTGITDSENIGSENRVT